MGIPIIGLSCEHPEMQPLADTLIQQGVLQLNQGRTNDAAETFQSVLGDDPNHSAAAYYLGLIRFQEAEYGAAKALLKIAAHHDRRNFQARLYLGYAHYYLDEPADAKTEFQRALKLEPRSADAHLALALVLEKGGDRSGASTHSRRAVQLAPGNTEILNFHVRLLMDAGQFAAAQSSLQQSLAIDPKNSQARAAEILIEIALHNLDAAQALFADLEAAAADWPGLNLLRANLFLARDQPEDAVKLLRQMSGDQQDTISIALLLGKALIACDAHEEAVAVYRELLKTVPGNFELHFNLSRALKAQGKFDESLIELNEAIRIDPSEGNIYYRALIYFARGDYAKGAADYEFRWHASADGFIRRPFKQPAWRPGADLTGQTVLVWGEQGVGDQILFGGLLSWLASTASRCTFECDQRLAPAFQRAFPDIDVVGAAAAPDRRTMSPDITMQIPLASLMAAIPGWPDNFDFATRYLEPDQGLSADIGKQLASAQLSGLKIGIAWHSARHKVGPKKSTPLALWGPILTQPNCSFINLQYGDTDADVASVQSDLGVQIYTHSDIDRFNDLDALLALIDNLDLVITTSNVTAHLAAGLGKPCWLLLQNLPIWYWKRAGDSVLFYPSVRAFRQYKAGDWETVIGDAAAALESWRVRDEESR